MVIDRSSLLNGLYEFSSEESGIVIGKPGIGKSYLLKQLKNKLIENGRLCFIIKIDNTFDFSHKAINNELGLKENWIETFKQIKIKDQKAVLIFDAFDAARDEKIRKGFLSQIRKAKRELADKWNVLVSVRTYDAFKSPELIQLFPDNKYNPERSYSRKFEIGELIEDEVLQVVSENQKFSDFYRNSNKELKQILHNPFFLEILDRIINDTTADEIEEIKKFKSESQLLKVYWDKKILSTQDSIAKELFLSSLTNLLVENRTLSYNKLSFFSSLTGNFGDIFSYFRSENIVDEISINNTRIAFSHNILFDYAVSIFCTNVDYDLFIAFIEADLTRPFFLRPSFLYFFTALWYEERKLFWDFYFKLFDNPKKEIQLFIRLVLNGIICSEYTSVEELNPLLTSINHEVSKPVIIRNILQSIRFIRTKSTSSDVALFGKISEFLNPEFLFDFAFLLDRSIPESGPEEAEIKVAGQTARNLLQYILNERNSNSKQFLDRIGSSRGIKLVAKTYYTDKVASRRLFEAVFLILNESSFEINYFTNLAEDVKYILNTDPEMVAEIYNKIFGYKETSDEQTQVGASVIMNFTSNRIQDFEMCYYRLQKYFPEFLAASPALAVKTGVLIVNQFINEDRANSNSETVFELDIAGRKLRFKTDYSSIWGDRTYGKPSETTVAIVKYFEELLTSGDFETLDSLVTIYLDNAISAFNWKLILGLFAKYPPAKSDEIFNYVASPFLMKHTDTSFEVRELLEKFSPYFNDSQIDKIESIIYDIYDDTKVSLLSKVLSRIPKERLQQDRSKKFMAQNEPIKNEPLFQYHSSSSTYTTDMWLEESGVDLNKPENKEIAKLSNRLQKFNNQYLNETPNKTDYNELLDLTRSFLDEINKVQLILPSELYFTALNEISKFGAIVSRDFAELSSTDYKLIKKIIYQGFAFETDQDKGDANSNSVHFTYSPTPKNSAAEALLNLYGYDQSEENLALLKEGLCNDNHIIRFNTVRNFQVVYSLNYPLYNDLLKDRLIKEDNGFIYSVLLGNIIFKKESVKQDAPAIFEILNKKAEKFGDQESFINNYTELLLYFLQDYQLPIAYESLFNAYPKEKLCNTIIFRLFERMHPSMPENNFSDNPLIYEDELKIIRNYILQAKQTLSKFDRATLNMQNGEVKHALFVLDKIIQRIYFVLQPKMYGRNGAFEAPIKEQNKKAFYFVVKPILLDIINVSGTITENGMIIGHTAHYFMQTLNAVLSYDPRDILEMVAQITRYSIQGGYTFDSMAVQEVVSLTEKLFADHRDLLLETEPFNNLLALLNIYINSGWINALELLWKLDEIFR